VDHRGLIVFAALLVGGCAKPVPLPEFGPHVAEAPILVPYPPPPARVEVVTPQPEKKMVWIDGQWIWRGRRWVWRRGGWEVPPAEQYYAPPVVMRQADGQLGYFQGGWRVKSGVK